MYCLAGINTNTNIYKYYIPQEKYFAPLRILNFFIKSFVNPFVDIALTFFGSSFNSFLFEVTFFSFFIKICLFYEISNIIFVAKFACANLAVKFYDFNLLNS